MLENGKGLLTAPHPGRGSLAIGLKSSVLAVAVLRLMQFKKIILHKVV